MRQDPDVLGLVEVRGRLLLVEEVGLLFARGRVLGAPCLGGVLGSFGKQSSLKRSQGRRKM